VTRDLGHAKMVGGDNGKKIMEVGVAIVKEDTGPMWAVSQSTSKHKLAEVKSKLIGSISKGACQ
jgi:hypothetical protein